jgi:hypothetical protein
MKLKGAAVTWSRSQEWTHWMLDGEAETGKDLEGAPTRKTAVGGSLSSRGPV